ADWNAASGDAKILNKPDLSVYATKNMGNQNIINLANPVNAQDAATKAYVDGASGIIETDPTWYGTADTLSAIGRKGKVGIGIFAPAAPLHVHGALTGGGNVLFTGEFKSNSPGNPPVSGSGTRMMWYPDKAAFRAGCVIGNNWSRDSVGNYSVAMGHNTKAKGSYSIAIGHVAIASGDNSLATGYNTLASGQYSTAMGARSEATGELSTAMGIYTTAPSYNEMVIGRYNTEYTPLGKRTWETTDRLFVIGIGTGNTTRRNAITVLKDGNTGLGTDTPSAPLHVNGTGSGEGNVLFTGSYKSSSPGDPPASGAGTRMMWYPDKAAFRAGGVDDANWDKDSIGYFSVAFGYNTKAKGNHSITMGHYTTASGFYSTAMGTSTNASGSSSTAMGFSTTASGSNSTAMGGYTTASGHSSTAMGTFTNASGSYSTAMGYKANAIGNYSFAINLSNETGPNLGANAFRISGAYTIGGNLAWTNYSDRRLKKDIQVLSTENNLTKIMQMNGVRFRWKDNDSLLNLGFIAQDVNDIIPESVRYDELNDIYSMEYTAIIPVLVEGIKEQQKIIEELKARIEALEKQRP
ncbi:MAG: tail fiber domain-containing protein, partial [Bacteroidales bacterium]|nr:tail fiber domain-containing protein [Bacteroidales bacterium]